MNTARQDAIATLLPNGQVLIAGGRNANGVLASAELYDPVTRGWSYSDGLNTARQEAAAILLPDGKVLIAGGSPGSGTLSSAELYDLGNNSWTYTDSLNTARSNFTATLLSNGKVLVAGGYNAGYLASAELYDPATNTWSMTGSLNTARDQATATKLQNGKVLVAGGYAGDNGLQLASAELYDAATNTWSAAGNLNSPRNYATATMLRNGQVLIMGGQDASSAYLASAELYNPTTNSWSYTTNMNIARIESISMLLPNGKVFIVGGDGNTGPLASAEIYGRNPLPALTIVPDSMFKVYGQPNPSFAATYYGFIDGETPSSLTGMLSFSTIANATSGAGSYAITASGVSSDFYDIRFQNGTFFVTPAPLTVMADDQTRSAGLPNPTFTASYNGFVNGDTANSLSGNLTFTTSATVLDQANAPRSGEARN